MAKVLSNSEFAQMIATRFPKLNNWDNDVNVWDNNGGYAIHAQETAKGWSSVIINNKPYGRMTADEKRAAIAWVMSAAVEIVTEDVKMLGATKQYFIEGAYMWHLENKDKGNFWYEDKKARIISIEKYI